MDTHNILLPLLNHATTTTLPHPVFDHHDTNISLQTHRHELLSLVSETSFVNELRRVVATDESSRLAPFADVLTWLNSQGVDTPLYDPANHSAYVGAMRIVPLLSNIARTILSTFQEIISQRYVDSRLPSDGAFLVFTSGLSFSYLLSYVIKSHAYPEVRILNRINAPKGTLELDSINNFSDPFSRNIAKSFLTSGHKLIIQSGVSTHVDRRLDASVFGPTIDTMLLCDILRTDSMTHHPRTFLDVGCGNGHITSTVVALYASVEHCVTLDVNRHAVNCTLRNLDANLAHFSEQRPPLIHKYGVVGQFNPDFFQKQFDLIVSNPPYIVAHTSSSNSLPNARYHSAVGGTDLLRNLVACAPTVLSDGGRMLIMTSSASLATVEKALPKGWEITPALHEKNYVVPFDVEAVLENKAWVDWLVQQRGIFQDDGCYTHYLTPIWVQKS